MVIRSGAKSRKSEVKTIKLPLTKKDVAGLKIGDLVLINGLLVTGRDKIHKYLCGEKIDKKTMPVDLGGAVLYHCGPIVKKFDGGYKVVAAGPTTSMRVEMYESRMIATYGLRGVMGKGGMGEDTLKALKKHGCVYFHAIGGAAAYLADRIKKVAGVWKLDDFGMAEAMWMLEVENFPAIVTMDAHGRSLHSDIEKKSRAALKKLLKI